MAWQHIHLVRQLGLPYMQKLILFALVSHIDDRDERWPSIDTICKDTGLAHRTVQLHLRALIDSGVVTREERHGQTALLRVHLCPGCTDAARTELQDADSNAHSTHPFTPNVHPSPAQHASDFRKELPLNLQEGNWQKKLSTNPTLEAQDRARTAPWWTTHSGIDQKGKELQAPARPGEAYADYKSRLFALEQKCHSGK